ncbi:MAG: TonB-dependent receptor, partial [Gammaproteobacteria bacterium]
WAIYDTELQDDYCVGCQAPRDLNGDGNTTGNGEGANWADEGDELPYTPDLKASLIARYTFPLGDFEAHVQGSLAYQAERNPSLNQRDNILYWGQFEESTLVDLTAGIAKDSYEVELFIKNATDEDSAIAISTQCAHGTCGTQLYGINARPRTWGLKFTQNF